MKKVFYILWIALSFETAFAQKVPVIITGGTIHTGTGQVIENGTLVFVEGKIQRVDQQQVPVNGNAAVIIDAKGKHIYPGLICLNTFMGLNEIDAVRATRDYTETGQVNPNVRSLIAYNTDSKVLPTALFNGILSVQVVPQGGLISGQSSLMRTTGWNWEDAQIKPDDAIHLNWPEYHAHHDKDKEKERIEKELLSIDDLFAQAWQYHTTVQHEETNLRFKAMNDLFTGKKKLFIHVEGTEGIVRCLNFCKLYPTIKLVLVGASDAYLLLDLIREQHVPVVLDMMHRLPSRAHEDIDMPYKLPAILMKAGIPFAIGHSGSWESRNLMFNAGTAVAHGLTKEEALMCITQQPAKICGVDDHMGTIEVGKEATIIISDGDILDMKSSHIAKIFVNGEEINTLNHQEQLYQKYMNKFGLK